MLPETYGGVLADGRRLARVPRVRVCRQSTGWVRDGVFHGPATIRTLGIAATNTEARSCPAVAWNAQIRNHRSTTNRVRLSSVSPPIDGYH